MSFPRYEAYRESGNEWLGDVPAHWTVVRLKQVAHVFSSNVDKKSYDGEQPVRLCNYTDVYYNDIITASIDFMPATASEDQVAKFTLRGGDVIITKDSESADDIAVAAYVARDLPGVVCGYHLAVVRPRARTLGAFLKRLFDSAFVKSSVAVKANGLTRVGLSQYALDNLDLPMPPEDEQRQICAFLDRETGKIDALIAEQQRLIKLLAEKRQAVISHAVTRGLNPDAPMKRSGLAWLGEVPTHWSVTRLRNVLAMSLQYGANEAADLDHAGYPRFIRITDIADDGRLRADTFRSLPPDVAKPYLLHDGDVLLARSGATVGKSFIYSSCMGDACFAGYLIRVRVDATRCVPSWLHHFSQSAAYWAHIGDSQIQATIQNVNAEKYSNLALPLPPLAEQQAIVEYVEESLGELTFLTREARHAVDLLRERRAALISAAVTGKIDVRGIVGAEQPNASASAAA